jgi:hypothetical protein
MDIIREFWDFLKVRKKFWLLPIILMLGLVLGLVFVASGSGALSPFIYALF